MPDTQAAYSYEGLTESDIKKAKKELGENPDKVLAQVASLRRWVNGMEHLTCRTDDSFLLRFLRTAKFEQSRAQQLLDNYCTVRASPRGCPEWFEPVPMDSPHLKMFLDMHFNIPLGYNDNGEAVIYSKMGSLDPDFMSLDELMRCAYMIGESIFSGQREVINGIRVINDMQGATKKQFDMWKNPKTVFKMMRNWQDAFPMRTKAIIYYREPVYFDVIFAVFQPLMKEKLRKRVHRCGESIEKLKKAIGPGAEKLLPPELGGKGKPMAELLAARTANFRSPAAQAERALLAEIRVDENKRRSDTKDYLKAFDDSKDPSMGISGTFTKLNVD